MKSVKSTIILTLSIASLLPGCRTRTSASGRSQILSSRAPQEGETVGRPFMDETTFANMGSNTDFNGRSGIESESVMGASGLTSDGLLAFMNGKNEGRDRTNFQRLATPNYAKAFTIEVVPENNTTWTKKSHDLRESSPYLAFIVEQGRASVKADSKEVDMSAGTDFNIDTYYDTSDFILLGNGVIARSRARQDSPGVGRRFLLQTKINLGVDSTGLKRAKKADTRVDRSDIPDNMNQLMDLSVKSGKNAMQSGSLDSDRTRLMPAFADVYKELATRNLLPDLDGHKKVLLLHPQAVLFSSRARYHMNLLSSSSIDQLLLKPGASIIKEIVDAATASTTLSDTDKTTIATLGNTLLSTTELAKKILPEIQKIDSAVTEEQIATWLNGPPKNCPKAQFEVCKVLFETVRKETRSFTRSASVLGDEWDVRRRKVEASATARMQLWFSNILSEFGFGGSGSFTNVLIDTFDFSVGVTFDDYNKLTNDEKIMKTPIPKEKIFFSSLVSEVQVELASNDFESCIENADKNPADQALQQRKTICQFVKKVFNESQDLLAKLRGEEVSKLFKDSKLYGDFKWANAEASKGENLLRIARDMPAPLPVLPPVETPPVEAPVSTIPASNP
ncbi:MAG: hypothetical protein NT027_09385 [Proteobacteria bacterium]|nr:hypothetical protein [Pseudomonadota bacterium]